MMRFGEVSLDPDDYPEFMVGRSWGPLPAVDGFGDPATPVAVPSATTVPGDWVDPDTTYASPEMRLMDVAPYDDRTGYQPQFPEQEDLSIFGWTDYPEPAVGFGALTYAQQCMADRDACYAKAGADNQAVLNCDSAYSTCFSHDPAFVGLTAARKAGAGIATSALVTLGMAGAVGAGVMYGVALIFHAKPAASHWLALGGGIATAGLVVASFAKALET
jgi:hypothetical protein